jgi:hypothetical protein
MIMDLAMRVLLRSTRLRPEVEAKVPWTFIKKTARNKPERVLPEGHTKRATKRKKLSQAHAAKLQLALNLLD